MAYDPIRTAGILASLDATMRRNDLSDPRAVNARVRFFTEATEQYALARLNRLGELVPRSMLSDRSLDVVFEDLRYSSDVVRAIVHRSDVDADFRRALVEQMGETVLATWRRNHGDLLSAVA